METDNYAKPHYMYSAKYLKDPLKWPIIDIAKVQVANNRSRWMITDRSHVQAFYMCLYFKKQ